MLNNVLLCNTMAKMHSRKRGTSGSRKPLKKSVPSWLKYSTKEIELLIAKYAKEGHSSSMIGLILRDSYGIPDVKTVCGKSITTFMKEKGLTKELPEDVVALMRRYVVIKKHLDANKHDMPALRGLQLTNAKINRLVKYYKGVKRIPANWKYNPASLKIYTE